MSLDAANAKQTLDDVARQTQMRGWEFNTERDVTIDPNTDGSITLPNNTLKVTSARCWSGNRLVPRGNRLFDPKKRTFNIGESVKVDLVVALEFQDLTEAARFYVTAVAARTFCLPKLPEPATFKYTEEVVESALATVEQEDTDLRDDTLKDSSPHFAQVSRR
jgi:hypothetical protein